MSLTVTVLAIVGLLVGVIVLLVVIWLLNNTLAPLREILVDVESARTAQMLERGVPGTDQLGQTRRLAESVVPLALAYLQKLSAAAPAAPPPPPPPPAPAPYQPSPYAAPAVAAAPAPAQAGLDAPVSDAWLRRGRA